MFAALALLVGLIYWINRERPLPWEELPSFTEHPVGPAMRFKLDLSKRPTIRVPIRVNLPRIRIERDGVDEVEKGSLKADYVLRLVPAGGRTSGYRMNLGGRPVEESEWPEGFAAWEDLFDAPSTLALKGVPVGDVLQHIAGWIGSRSIRAGERPFVQLDSKGIARMLPGQLPDLGPGRGWAACIVESIGSRRVRLSPGAGFRLRALPELPADLEQRWPPPLGQFVAKFLKPLGRIHEIRARLEGTVTAGGKGVVPARVALDLKLRIFGEDDRGRSYELSVDALVSTDGPITASRGD